MKITTTAHNVNPSTELLLCFDVSKARLNLFTRYERHTRRMQTLRGEVESLAQELKSFGELPPLDEDVSGVTLFNMGRLLGETGPLRDFRSRRALLRLRRPEPAGAPERNLPRPDAHLERIPSVWT